MKKNDQFFVVLPSNSSMHVYPDNTTTHFSTYLPQQINLDGAWSVALTEIQIPMTMYHINKKKKIIYMKEEYLVKFLKKTKKTSL